MNTKKLFSQIFVSVLLFTFLAGPLAEAQEVNCQYRRVAVAEGWAPGSDEYWHLKPVNEKSVFSAGEKVQFFAQAGPLYSWHQWRLKLYKNNSLFRELTSDALYPEPVYGWNYSNFIPYMTDLPISDYQVDYFLNTGAGFANIGSVVFRVAPPAVSYTFHHAVTAEGWRYGAGDQYWNLIPVNQKSEFGVKERVHLLVQVRKIYVNHRYKVELYRGSAKLWEHATNLLDVGGGWDYSNFYPYYDNAAPGDYNFKAYIDAGQGWRLLAEIPFSVKGPREPYEYRHTFLAAGWRYGVGDDYWNLEAVDPKNVFAPRERIYALAQVKNIYSDHRWKVELYRDGMIWSFESSWHNVGADWTYGNFFPHYDGARPGNYEFRIYIDIGSGFVLLDRKPFIVSGPGEEFNYVGATVASGWRYGSGDDYWNIQPVDPRTVFSAGEDVYFVAQARNVYVDHRWKIETYKSGALEWSHASDWFDVGSGWQYSNFYPANFNSLPGSYEFKLYVDIGSGYNWLDTKSFTVIRLHCLDANGEPAEECI